MNEARDVTGRFSGRAELYDRWRPGYPDEVLDVLREEIGLSPDWVVADVGAGTGLSSRLFLDAGHRVAAVEPNAEMRAVAEAKLGGRSGFRSVDGTAEATRLPDASVDLVVAGQAFHWFDVEAARREFRRILRGGQVVLLYNTRRTGGTPLLEAYEALLRRHGTDYDRVRHDRRTEDAAARLYGGRWGRRVLENRQELDLEGLFGRTLSCSYVPGEGEAGHEELGEALEELFERHAREGTVRLEYDLEIWFGRPV